MTKKNASMYSGELSRREFLVHLSYFCYVISYHSELDESHSVIARCMGKTCGRAVCGGGDSCHSSGTAWRNPFSETTVKQNEK